MVNDVPVPNTVPVVDESANQLNVVPVGAEALNVIAAAPQDVALIVVATAVGNALYVATTAVLVDDTQPPLVFLAAA